MGNVLKCDMRRNSHIPQFQRFFRLIQETKNPILKIVYKVLFRYFKNKCCTELSSKTKIGAGLYIGHPYSITINPNAVIGENCNIHKGVTIGQENRGKRKGVPIIGNKVWIGVNAVVVGKITVGDNVLIAPNSYVNCDVPSNSVVFGNPCIIKHKENATEGYINNII